MKRIITLGLWATFTQSAIAADACFDMQCADCNSYTPQHIRLIDGGPPIWAGTVQANDNSFGYAMLGTLQGSHFIFTRYDNGKDRQYLYDVDLATWDGSGADGVRYKAKYRLKSDGSGTDYEFLGENQLRVVAATCP